MAPAGRGVLDTEDVYERLAGYGLDYGPVFQGLGSVWRRDGEVFAEVVPTGDRARSLRVFCGASGATGRGVARRVLESVEDGAEMTR